MSKLIKRKDGSYSKRGLWDNIRDNIGSGKKPTKEMLEQERKIKQYANGGPDGDEDPEKPPRKKGALKRLLGIKSGFSPSNIAPGSAGAQQRNKQGCTSPECRDKMGGRDAAGWTRNGGGNMGGKDTQSGQAPPPLEVMNAEDADRSNFLEDARYPDKVIIDPKTGEKTVIQDRSNPYNMFQRLGNRWRGYEKTDFGGATMGGKNMEYIDANTPNLIANEQPKLGPMKWTPMTYSTTPVETQTETKIPMRPTEQPKQGFNFDITGGAGRNYPQTIPLQSAENKKKPVNVAPKFQKAPNFKKGGFKNKSFIEDSKEIKFGGVSKNKRK